MTSADFIIREIKPTDNIEISQLDATGGADIETIPVFHRRLYYDLPRNLF